MLRITVNTMLVVLALLVVLSARADYEAGRQAWDAGRTHEALAQWQASAATGDPRAMLALGRLHLQGLGVLQDYVEAHKWFNLAASRGDAQALAERDALTEKMTPAQVAEAQALARTWRPNSVEVPSVPEETVAGGAEPPRVAGTPAPSSGATSADAETGSTETQAAPAAADSTPRALASSDVRPGAALEPKCAAMEEGAECWMELADEPGCYVWEDHNFPEQTVTWSGPCTEGVIVGEGTLVWTKDGKSNRSTGTASDGKQQGHWVLRFASGAVGEGPYVDGKRQGHWVWRLADGAVGEGPYVDGKRQGHWVLRLADGGVQEGPYVDGEKQGRWLKIIVPIQQGVEASCGFDEYDQGEEIDSGGLAMSECSALQHAGTAPSASPREDEASLDLEPAQRARIQLRLRALGFDPGPPDGIFGERTRHAIRLWQASQSDLATGYLDASSAQTLQNAAPASAGQQAARETIARALATAESIEDRYDRSEAFASIAAAQAATGAPDESARTFARALEIAQGIKAVGDRSRSLRAIGEAHATVGNADEARRILAKAVPLAERDESLMGLGATAHLANIAKVQAAAGGLDESAMTIAKALAAAERIESDPLREPALVVVAEAQAASGDVREALATAERIEAPHARSGAFTAIATVQATAGDVRGAAETFTKALETAERIKFADFRTSEFGSIARAQAVAGDVDEATRTIAKALASAEKIGDAGDRSRALVSIAGAQAAVGMFEEALATAERLEDASDRNETFGAIAAAQATAGMSSEARATADRFLAGRHYVRALTAIAKEQATLGGVSTGYLDGESAETLLTATPSAGQQGAMDTLTEALNVARSEDYDKLRAGALTVIAVVQAKAGDRGGAARSIAEALAVARSITDDSSDRDSTLGRIAIAQAKMGDIAGALGNARSIAGFTSRLSAFAKIAKVQLDAGDRGGAARSIVEVQSNVRSIANIEVNKAAKLEAEATRAAAQTTASSFSTSMAELADNVEKYSASILGRLDKRILELSLRSITELRVQLGDVTGAWNTARSITDESTRALIVSGIAKAQAEAGDIADAMETARSIASIAGDVASDGVTDFGRLLALVAVAEVQAKAGDHRGADVSFAEATVISDNSASDYSRAKSSIAIARGQAEAGHDAARSIDEALSAVESVSSLLSPRLLGKIAVVQAKAGDIAKALSIARRIDSEYQRAEVLSGIAEAQLDAVNQP